MLPVSPARSVAFDILCRVEKGGYASDLLLSRGQDLDSRDAALATELVLGALRYQGQAASFPAETDTLRVRHPVGRVQEGVQASGAQRRAGSRPCGRSRKNHHGLLLCVEG